MSIQKLANLDVQKEMISSGAPQLFVPFGREHYALHPGNPQPQSINCYFPNTSVHTDAGEDILDAIREFSLLENEHKEVYYR